VTIATNAAIPTYGVRYANSGQGGGYSCSSTGNGPQTCYALNSSGQPVGKATSAVFTGPLQSAPGTAIPTGLFTGWQYWQASVAMQLLICIVALAFSALVLPPVRRYPWRKRAADSAAQGE
jgi:hypothetical protein